MAETPTDVLVAGYQDIDDGDEGLRVAGRAGQGQEGQDRGCRSSSRTPRTAASRCEHDRRPPRTQGRALGRRSGPRCRPGRAAAARLDGDDRRGGGWLAGKFAANAGAAARSTTRSARTCRPARRGSSRSSTTSERLGVEQALGSARVQSVVAGRQGGHGGAEGLARRGDGQVQPRPHGAPDPRPELRRRRSAARSTSRSPTGR